MGGYSSGRYRTRNRGAIEQVRRLDMRHLRRIGFLRPGERRSGVIRWNRGDEQTGSMSVTVDLTDIGAAFALLEYSVDGDPRRYTIQIDAEPCQLGGHRYYFRCPTTWRRCVVLAYVNGTFASRQAQRLNYGSQSEGRLDRLYRARAKAEARAFGKDGYPRPRGANRERLVQRWIDVEETTDDLFTAECARRFGISF